MSTYDWFERHEKIVALLGGTSLFLFVVTLLAIPLLVIALREDYFVRENRISIGSGGMLYLAVRLVLLTVKNALGLVVLLLGFIMLFVPGQGLLTLLVGLLLLNFPGKRRLELKLVCAPRVLASVRWIRAKAGVEPLKLPE